MACKRFGAFVGRARVGRVRRPTTPAGPKVINAKVVVHPRTGQYRTVNCAQSVVAGTKTATVFYMGDTFTSRTSVRTQYVHNALTSDRPDILCTDFRARSAYDQMTLCEGARRVRDVPNAGGDSVVSEVLSCEMMTRLFNAKLIKTEMEVQYFPMGGAMTDYVVSMFGEKIGVSVTRAMKYRGEYEREDARTLLHKKLNGAVTATRNCGQAWTKQILHVWAQTAAIARTLLTAYALDLSADVRADTVVLVTVVPDDTDTGIFRTTRSKNRTCG